MIASSFSRTRWIACSTPARADFRVSTPRPTGPPGRCSSQRWEVTNVTPWPFSETAPWLGIAMAPFLCRAFGSLRSGCDGSCYGRCDDPV